MNSITVTLLYQNCLITWVFGNMDQRVYYSNVRVCFVWFADSDVYCAKDLELILLIVVTVLELLKAYVLCVVFAFRVNKLLMTADIFMYI